MEPTTKIFSGAFTHSKNFDGLVDWCGVYDIAIVTGNVCLDYLSEHHKGDVMRLPAFFVKN